MWTIWRAFFLLLFFSWLFPEVGFLWGSRSIMSLHMVNAAVIVTIVCYLCTKFKLPCVCTHTLLSAIGGDYYYYPNYLNVEVTCPSWHSGEPQTRIGPRLASFSACYCPHGTDLRMSTQVGLHQELFTTMGSMRCLRGPETTKACQK